jgi:hypothetical protein
MTHQLAFENFGEMVTAERDGVSAIAISPTDWQLPTWEATDAMVGIAGDCHVYDADAPGASIDHTDMAMSPSR